jgi:hypothetical protein
LNLRVPWNAGKLSSGLSSSAQLHRVSQSYCLHLWSPKTRQARNQQEAARQQGSEFLQDTGLWATHSYNPEDCNLLYEHVRACSYICTKAEFHIPIALCSVRVYTLWLITIGPQERSYVSMEGDIRDELLRNVICCKMHEWLELYIQFKNKLEMSQTVIMWTVGLAV